MDSYGMVTTGKGNVSRESVSRTATPKDLCDVRKPRCVCPHAGMVEMRGLRGTQGDGAVGALGTWRPRRVEYAAYHAKGV